MIGFSKRTEWHRDPNRLSMLLEKCRNSGRQIIDLTVSNPTACGIDYPVETIAGSLANPASLAYHPDPRGLVSAREEIAAYYGSKGVSIDPSQIVLTASTSEAYHHLFTLLCNPGDNVVVPLPSYPLFDYIASIGDTALKHYSLRYDNGWAIDFASLEASIEARTKAIVLVHPHNPTGFALSNDDFGRIAGVAEKHRLALIADEVFGEYLWNDDERILPTTARGRGALTFTLNGISKMAGLPQMKLGWIVVSGPPASRDEALNRLEILGDTFLSVNTPVQVALPSLMKAGSAVRNTIRRRLHENHETLMNAVRGSTGSLLKSDGGWYGVIRVPKTRSDEDWALRILEETGVSLYPGYFFDFEEEGFLVVSLLVETEEFRKACGLIFGCLNRG